MTPADVRGVCTLKSPRRVKLQTGDESERDPGREGATELRR